MQILFKNTTVYTRENCTRFEKFHTNKFGKRELLKFILIALCVIYILIFNLLNKNWYTILAVIILGGLAYLYYKLVLEKETNDKKNKAKEFTFYFYEKYIKIRCKRQFERMKYFELKKIYETKKYFYLYLDEKSSLILDKEGFSIGSSREFSKFIKRKCPFKYNNEMK